MDNNIFKFLTKKSKYIFIISILSTVFLYGISFLFSNAYKTDVYCYSNIFDNVHNKSVFESFNTLLGSEDQELIHKATNIDIGNVKNIKKVDFYEILSEENNYFKLTMISKSNDITKEFLDGIIYYYDNSGINKEIIKSEIKMIKTKIKNKEDAILKIDQIYEMMKMSSNVIFESNLELSRNRILNELEDEKVKLLTNNGLNIINKPFPPKFPYFPNRIIFIVFGFVLGFIASLFYFVLAFEIKKSN